MVSDDDKLSANEEFNVEVDEDSASASVSASTSPKMLSPATISRRMRANPLKNVAHLLREKLVAAHGAPCNMLQVALELHSQAQDKKNTTLRRIYDVVNVCEGAVVENSESSGSNRKLVLEMEKGQTRDRILQKTRLCDTLSKQVTILQKLVAENQGNTETSDDHGDIFSELSSLHSLEGYNCEVDYLICDSFVDQQQSVVLPKRLHLPFVMMATNPDANVEIFMSGDPPYEVHLQLDQSYCLIDHIQMIKMLPERRRAAGGQHSRSSSSNYPSLRKQ